MAKVKSDRYLLVAKALAEGKGYREALLAAGYSEGMARGKQLYWTENGVKKRGSPPEHPVVARHLEAFRAEVRKAAAVSIENIAAELEEARLLAKEVSAPNAMVQASMGKAKLYGLIVDKSQAVKPIDSMSESELAALIGEDSAGAGDAVH